jgi:GntR family transcriptional repressor for pyruvate dehydrogenase complex
MKTITKMPIIDQVVENIRTSITSGEFKIEAKLPSELSLCETLSVGRSTIREALRVLQTQGYVELKPGKGAFVRDTDPHDKATIKRWFKESAPKVEDLNEVRGVLEILALKKAVERCKNADIKELTAINNAFARSVNNFNVSDMVKYDEAFHIKIFSISGNAFLINFYNILIIELKKYRLMSFSLQENGISAMGPHKKILEAIKDKNVSAAGTSMEIHLQLVISDMKAIINSTTV